MNYTMESFMRYCESNDIANEKLDTRILDLNFGKTMKLFHGTKYKLTGPIKPTSVNMGNRLTSVRTSSFWTKSFEYAAFWAATWTCAICRVRECIDIDTKKVVLPGFYIGEKTGKTLPELLKTWIDDDKLYVYEATVETKYVGRGQCPIDEYTVDIPVKPDKIHELKWNDIAKYIIFAKTEEEYDMYLSKFTVSKSYSKSKTNLREKLIFKNSDSVRLGRAEIYRKIE